MRLGRPRGPGKSKLDPYRPEIEALLRNGSTQTCIAKCYGTTVGNLHHWLKQRGITRAKALHIADVDAPIILRFLQYLEQQRGNAVRSRNIRLAAIRSFFRLLALREPAS